MLVWLWLARATTEAPTILRVAHLFISNPDVQDALHGVSAWGLGAVLAHCCCTAAAGGLRLLCCMQPRVCFRTSMYVLQNVWLQLAHPAFEPCPPIVAE